MNLDSIRQFAAKRWYNPATTILFCLLSLNFNAGFYPDNVLVSFSESLYYVQESAESVSVVVELSHITSIPSRVEFKITNERATAWEDYLPVRGTLVFMPGEVQKIIAVSIVNDTRGEPAESFDLSLIDARNASLGEIASAKIVIQDDDNSLSANWLPIDTPSLYLELSDDTGGFPSLLGYSVSMAGDVDGDSFGDILIGAYENSDFFDEAGIAYLIYAKNLATIDDDYLDLGMNAIGFYGSQDLAWVGHSVSSGGDIDGDGAGDFAISGRFLSVNDVDRAGVAYIFFSSDLPQKAGEYAIDDIASVTLTRTKPFSEVGFEVFVGGDVDGDDIADVLVRANFDPTRHTGGVYLVPGSVLRNHIDGLIDLDVTQGVIRIFSDKAYVDAGRTITLLDDFDGDRLPEIALGSRNGMAFYAPDQESVRIPGLWILPSRVLLGKNEINLDKDEEIIRFNLDTDVSHHIAVGSAGDLDQDGLGDAIVGIAPTGLLEDSPGSAAVILGSTLSNLAGENALANEVDLFIISEEQGFYERGDHFGWSVTEKAGDIDLDGIPDLVIGARGSSLNGIQSGAIYIIPGELVQRKLLSDQSILYVQREAEVMVVVGSRDLMLLGSKRRISNASDIDGDGYFDILVGAPGEGSNGDLPGSVFIIWGEVLTRLWVQVPE
ncbi:MAG: hypothetical protein DWQ07_09055 [Chloroflexi bacterium]|nr:MAG: hypothetical protein DWQ07_09055 [Chloroflexota bacterium]MBL1193139.1 hypothetical protein [Chloroflexota bacterium]